MSDEKICVDGDRLALAEKLVQQVNVQLEGRLGFKKVSAEDILSDKPAGDCAQSVMTVLIDALRAIFRKLMQLIAWELLSDSKSRPGSEEGKPLNLDGKSSPKDEKNVIRGIEKGDDNPMGDAVEEAVKAFEHAGERDFVGEAVQNYLSARDRFSNADSPPPTEIVVDYVKASSRLVEQLDSGKLDEILARYRREPDLLEAVESARRALIESERQREKGAQRFSILPDAEFGPVAAIQRSLTIDKPVFAPDVEGIFGSAETASRDYLKPDSHQM